MIKSKKSRYRIRNTKKVIQVEIDDVNKFNEAQFATSKDCVFFRNCKADIPFGEYSEKTRGYRDSDIIEQKTYDMDSPYLGSRDKGRKGTLLVSGRNDLPIDQNFSFLKIRYEAYINKVSDTLDNMREDLIGYREYVKDREQLVEDVKKYCDVDYSNF